ncbi:MAG TPA: PIN domain-containing protein [Rhizomicrobium sp.]|nr:PIN domain-containing protein [Rhizomicrobium sp.]
MDTTVVIDIVGGDPNWSPWSTTALTTVAARDRLAINDIVYAELAAGFDNADALQSALDDLRLSLVRIPVEALFLAGHAFRRYRRAGGAKANVLADFFIGAYAAVARAPLLTRDTRRIRAHFPTVELLAPSF